MAEILIKAVDSSVPDSVDKWYAARPVVAMPDGHGWGSKEGLPEFYLIKVPGVSVDDVKAYLEEWNHVPTIDVVGSDLVVDGFRIRINSNRVSASGKHKLTLAQVESYITGWGGVVVNVANESVTFDVTIYDALASPSFWGLDDMTGFTFVETSYTQGAGSHTIQVLASPYTNKQMGDAVQGRGGALIPTDSFSITRDAVRKAFEDDITSKLREMRQDHRRWYVSAAGMVAMAADPDGVLTVTPAQLANNLVDGLTE